MELDDGVSAILEPKRVGLRVRTGATGRIGAVRFILRARAVENPFARTCVKSVHTPWLKAGSGLTRLFRRLFWIGLTRLIHRLFSRMRLPHRLGRFGPATVRTTRKPRLKERVSRGNRLSPILSLRIDRGMAVTAKPDAD